jgi:fatty-acyl-CoA synthase
MTSIFDQHLPRTAANFAPLSPLGFIERTAEVYPDRLAIVHGSLRQTWAQTYARCRQLASSLRRAGIGKNDTVAVMLPNTPPMVEAHFGVPMAGAVLNALNTRLDPEAIAFMLDHGEAKAVIVDPEFAPTLAKALALRQSSAPLLLIDVEDEVFGPALQKVGSTTYEAFVAAGDPQFAWELPGDEWDAIALNYTSAPRAIPRAWCITTGARPPTPSATCWSGTCPSTPCTCGRCPCSTATAGAFPGRWRRARASTCACAAWRRRPSSMPSASTASRTTAARPSCMGCW